MPFIPSNPHTIMAGAEQKDEELRKTRADMDDMRRTFLAQMSDKDELLNTQRRDMSASFDELARKQEAEAAKREEALRKELQDAQQKDHHHLEDKMKLDQEVDQLRHTMTTLRAQMLSKDADLEKSQREHEARVALLKKEIDAAQSAATISATQGADLAGRLHAAERAEREVKHEMEEMREGLEVSHRRALQDQEKALRELIRDAEARCEALATRLSSSEGERERYQQAAARASREAQEQELVQMEALEGLRRKAEAAEVRAAEAAQKASMQRALLEEELAGAREKMEALKRAQEERRCDMDALRAEIQSASEREEALHRQLARSELRAGADGTTAAAEAEAKVQERFSELLKSIGQQRDRAIADKEQLQEQLAQALKQLQVSKDAHALAQHPDKGTRPKNLSVDADVLEAETPLDSPIQMPPFPATPVPHNHNLSSRPTTADTDMWRSRPATAEGPRPGTADGAAAATTGPSAAEHGAGPSTRPATAEGVREAAEAVGRHADSGEQASRAVAEARRLRVRLAELEEQNDRLRSVVAQMRSEMERMTAHKSGAAAAGEMDEEKEVLVQKLLQTEAVLRRVTSERDKLISISNVLRADLKRAQSAAVRAPLRDLPANLAPDIHAFDAREFARASGEDAVFGAREDGIEYGNAWEGEGAGGVREAWGEIAGGGVGQIGGAGGGNRGHDGHGDEAAGMEMVELAMAELVHRNRQLTHELTRVFPHSPLSLYPLSSLPIPPSPLPSSTRK